MAEVDKKKSYTIDMKADTKKKLSTLALRLHLPQGDALDYALTEFLTMDANRSRVENQEDLMTTMISQQNQIITLLQEQNALLQRLEVESDE